MDKQQKNLLLAICIGDAHVKPCGELNIVHCERQTAFAEYKRIIVSEILAQHIKLHSFKNGKYNSVRWSVGHNYFRIIRKYMYVNNQKVITPTMLNRLSDQGIAIWFMDDGSLSEKKRNGKTVAWEAQISTYCSLSEAKMIVNFFKERYDIEFTVKQHLGLYSVRCGTKAARKFCAAIDEHVIPCMKYKTRILVR